MIIFCRSLIECASYCLQWKSSYDCSLYEFDQVLSMCHLFRFNSSLVLDESAGFIELYFKGPLPPGNILCIYLSS